MPQSSSSLYTYFFTRSKNTFLFSFGIWPPTSPFWPAVFSWVLFWLMVEGCMLTFCAISSSIEIGKTSSLLFFIGGFLLLAGGMFSCACFLSMEGLSLGWTFGTNYGRNCEKPMSCSGSTCSASSSSFWAVADSVTFGLSSFTNWEMFLSWNEVSYELNLPSLWQWLPALLFQSQVLFLSRSTMFQVFSCRFESLSKRVATHPAKTP